MGKQRRIRIARVLLAIALLLLINVIWSLARDRQSVSLAVAKGANMLAMPAAAINLAPDYLVDQGEIQQIVLTDPSAKAILSGDRYDFVTAIHLTPGEARYWQDEGCGRSNCAQATFYDYTSSQTVQAVVNLDTRRVVSQWANDNARPIGSSQLLPKAMAIASADPQVRAILGDIGAADPAMIPMSGWLADNDCRDDWCVDLTFHDPSGTGRIFHVFVNLQTEQVARTFYTRARADRSAAKPLQQRNAFTDGCREQYGWKVCWEMTAHDGINFIDATHNGQSVFTSAKIGQIEAWYPSWPGGYRDEIGFSATVPPFGGTEVNDLGDGFEVRQTFTEFTRWPNCICCYRYEEIMRFDSDGGFEPRFVSHGPGCDDLSIYRPFWRIDLALDGAGGDEVWLWDQTQWVEQPTEFEEFPIVDDLSPDGYKLATIDGDMSYRWTMDRTDPLGLDEGYLFLLKNNALEGEDPITTGPGDTFIPPRQWINGDDLSGEDVVVWYVPVLKTKKGGPWWCMPDPEPDFSPCEAILRVDPAGELTQPTAEELAALQAAATPTPQAAQETPQPTPTPRPIDGEDAPTIIQNAGCTACHQIGALGEAHKVGPNLSLIGIEASGRVEGMSAEQYIRQSIEEPNAYLAPVCPNGPCLPNIMPQNFHTRLRPAQIDTLVAFLLEQRSAPPETPQVGAGVAVATAISKPVALGKVAPQAAPTTLPAGILIQIVLIGVLAVAGIILLVRK